MPQSHAELGATSDRVKGNPPAEKMPRQATKAPQDREARLEALLCSLDDLLFELDENGTYVEIWGTNDALLIAPRSELLGHTLGDALGAEMGRALTQLIGRVIKNGRPEIYQYALDVPAGIRWFQGRLAPIAGPGSSPTRVCLLVRDITEQKVVEQEVSRLLSREQLLSRLSEVVPVGLFEIDLAGHITFSNDRIYKIMGDSSANSVETLTSSVVVAEDRATLESALATVLADQRVDDLEIRFCHQAPDDQRGAGVVRVCQLSLREKGTENSIIGAGRARDAHPLRVLDPACGSGSFLISAYQTLLDWYLAALSKKPNLHSKGRDPALRPAGVGSWQLATSFRKRILLNHIFGVDIDPQAVEVTKLSLLLKCLEGETAATISQQLKFFQERALPDLDENIRCGNSLIGFDYLEYEPAVTDDEKGRAIVNMFDWHSEFPQVFSGAKSGFDIVIGNPPYVLLQDEFRDDRQLAYFRDRYHVASYKIDTYHLFLECGTQLTRSGGYFSMITPTNYLTNNNLTELRTLLLDDTAIDSITVIDGAVFPRRAVDCAVIASRPHSRTENPFPMLRAQPGPHQSLVISGNLRVTPDRVRRSRHSLFTGTATGELASILDRMESCETKLGDIAQISFGKQLRDRRKYPTDVLEGTQRRGGVPAGYARCYTGSDVRRWSVTWSGLALLDKEEARRGGCWDPKIQRAREKLITRQIGRYPTWGIDEVGYQCLNTVFMAMLTASTVDPHYALGVLNSAPLRSYWLDRFYDQRITFPKIKGTYLKQLPFPSASEDAQRTIRSHVESLIKLTTELDRSSTDAGRRQVERAMAAHEQELDERVATLFGLGSHEAESLRQAAGQE